jgi:hypothetical protein
VEEVRLFTKEWADFDFLTIELLLPSINIKDYQVSWENSTHKTSLELDTYFKYEIEESIYYVFSFRLLGFGISWYRQTSF